MIQSVVASAMQVAWVVKEDAAIVLQEATAQQKAPYRAKFVRLGPTAMSVPAHVWYVQFTPVRSQEVLASCHAFVFQGFRALELKTAQLVAPDGTALLTGLPVVQNVKQAFTVP